MCAKWIPFLLNSLKMHIIFLHKAVTHRSNVHWKGAKYCSKGHINGLLLLKCNKKRLPVLFYNVIHWCFCKGSFKTGFPAP